MHLPLSSSTFGTDEERNAVRALEKQLTEEKGKTDFVKVNEDLRRLAVDLKRNAA